MNVTFYADKLPARAPVWAVSPAVMVRTALDWINSTHTNPRRKWGNYRACLRCAKGWAK